MGKRVRNDVGVLLLSQVGAISLSFLLTPFQLHAMGAERYGIVAITAALLGYLSFFDCGVGWALTHFVPHYLSAGREVQLRKMIFAALVVSVTLGLAVCLVLWMTASWLASHLLSLSSGAVESAVFAIRAAGIGVPVMLVTSVFSGIGRGLGLFAHNGLIRFVQFGSLNILWAIFASSNNAIVLISITQLVIAAIILITWIVLTRARFPNGMTLRTHEKASYFALLHYGFFSSISSLGYLLLNAADKLVLAAIVPLREVIFYTVPYSLASQIPVVSATVAAVLFPRFSAAAATEEGEEISKDSAAIADASRRLLAVFNASVTIVLVLWGPLLLRHWLGGKFGGHAGFPLQILAVGFGVLALGAVDQVFLQAHGRVVTSAVIYLVLGPMGLVGLAVMAARYGVGGAASATGTALALVGVSHIIAAARGRSESILVPIKSAVGPWILIGFLGVGVFLFLREVHRLPPVLAFGLPSALLVSIGPLAVRRAVRGLRRWSRSPTSSPPPDKAL